jgi:hypothetical protein
MDIKRLNYVVITLVPKVKEAIKIQQYKPVCLLNNLYKWFTEVLTIWNMLLRELYKDPRLFL